MAIGKKGGEVHAFAADEDGRALRIVSLDADRELPSLPLEGSPSALLLTPEGRLYVALADVSAVAVYDVVDPERPLRRCSLPVAAEPTGLALGSGGERLLVVSRWGQALSQFWTRNLARERVVPLARDPFAVAASSDGGRAFVTHVVGGRMSVVDLDGAAREIRMRPERGALPPTPQPATVSRTLTHAHAVIATGDGRMFVPSVLAQPEGDVFSGSSGYGGGMDPVALGQIALVRERDETHWVSNGFRQARGGHTCLLPRAAAWDEALGLALVTCLGTNALIALDMRDPYPHGVERFFSKVPPGPTGVAVDAAGRRAIVWSQHVPALTVVRLRRVVQEGWGPLEVAAERAIELPQLRPLDPEVARGRALFHAAGDRRIADDGRSCASCHPAGRDDALTWQTPEGPRQTPMLLARLAGTGPYGWDGDFDTTERHLDRTLKRLHGLGLAPADRAALFAYIESLAIPAVWQAPGDAPLAARGEALFAAPEVGCARCHDLGQQTTDGKSHDIATRTGRDLAGAFDTPSLRFVAQSGPYFHDGRYATLRELLVDPQGMMAPSAALPPEDIDALVAYLETL